MFCKIVFFILVTIICFISIDNKVYANSDVEAKIIQYIDNYKASKSSKHALYVFDLKTHKNIFSYEQQGFNANQPLHIASSSKWVSAAVILGLVNDGRLSLDDKANYYLKTENGQSWQGDKGAIKLSELLSFRSGFIEKGRACLLQTRKSLAECVDRFYIENNFALDKPFYYGNIHYSVAARMAEIASKMSWDKLFEHYIKQPLKFSSSAYYTNLKDDTLSMDRPFISGGLYISVNDYIKFMAMIANYGNFEGKQILPKYLIEEMEKSHFTKSTRIVSSPAKKYNDPDSWSYGFGNWVRCLDDSCDHKINLSHGAYGFYPWIDRNLGYYAIMATSGRSRFQGGKAVEFVEKIRPLIEHL